MAFPIPPISSAIPTPNSSSPAGRAGAASPIGDDQSAERAGQGGFTRAVGDALSDLNQLENAVEEASIQAATGDLSSVSDYMIAATEAQIATEITVAVRDRTITAFNDIMRMQI